MVGEKSVYPMGSRLLLVQNENGKRMFYHFYLFSFCFQFANDDDDDDDDDDGAIKDLKVFLPRGHEE